MLSTFDWIKKSTFYGRNRGLSVRKQGPSKTKKELESFSRRQSKFIMFHDWGYCLTTSFKTKLLELIFTKYVQNIMFIRLSIVDMLRNLRRFTLHQEKLSFDSFMLRTTSLIRRSENFVPWKSVVCQQYWNLSTSANFLKILIV